MEEKIINSGEQSAGKTPRQVLSREKKRLVFYICMMALPVLQFCVFYIYQNLSSIMMAFETHNVNLVEGTYSITRNFDNFKTAWRYFLTTGDMFKNSLEMLIVTIVISMNIAIVFSFYIYKQCPGATFFKVSLFLPQVISSVVFVMLYQYLVNSVYAEVMKEITGNYTQGLLSNPDTTFGTVMFYCVWASFGTNVLMYTGTMSGIDESLVESVQLDGANIIQEFIHITFPMIYRTYVTFLIVSIAGLFTSTMHLHTFFGTQSNYKTIGYDIYINVLNSDVYVSPGSSWLSYPVISAYGLILTAFVAPATLLLKKFLEKIGPSTN